MTSFSLLFTIFAISSCVCFTYTVGETYNVGEDDGWTEFPNFSDWAQGKRFHVGDTLVFNYAQELHNVIQVNETAYEECAREPNQGLLQTGSDTIALTEAGNYWYICGVDQHCENGQKLHILVHP